VKRVSVALSEDVLQRVDHLNQSLERLNQGREWRTRMSRDQFLGKLIERALRLAEAELAERLKREGGA
jgi:hypothetical protein